MYKTLANLFMLFQKKMLDDCDIKLKPTGLLMIRLQRKAFLKLFKKINLLKEIKFISFAKLSHQLENKINCTFG